jgi:hypothetical protein
VEPRGTVGAEAKLEAVGGGDAGTDRGGGPAVKENPGLPVPGVVASLYYQSYQVCGGKK